MINHNETRTLGAILYENFGVLDLYGPLKMFGNVVPEKQIITVAERTGQISSAQGPKTIAEFSFDERMPAFRLDPNAWRNWEHQTKQYEDYVKCKRKKHNQL